jgi:thiamine-monophosphate kinase
MSLKAKDIGEDALIQRLLEKIPHSVSPLHTGPGDDCAVAPLDEDHWQLLKTDAIVESVHFFPTDEAKRVGWKAIARVVSDFAAMGGRPQWFLVTLGIPASYSVEKLEQLYVGMGSCLQTYGGTLCGGETTSIPAGGALMISIAATGLVKKSQLTLRSTASLGDGIFVTGRLGGSLAGRHLDVTPRLHEAEWLTSRAYPSAMMDLSDGLAKDLPRLAAASNLGYQLDTASLPCHDGCSAAQALSDGEDYELLFTAAPDRITELHQQWSQAFPEMPLTRVGTMVPLTGSMHLSGGWDHFAAVR